MTTTHSNLDKELKNIFGYYKIKNDEIWTHCPNPKHKDDNPTNFSFNLNTGQGFCFACGYKTNLIEFSLNKQLRYDFISRIWENIAKEDKINFFYEIDSNIIQHYKNFGYSKYALERVGDKNILEKYEVYSDGEDNPIFLLRNKKRYTAIWGRIKGQYLLLENPYSKRNGAIFGEHLENPSGYVLTEGFFDAMRITRDTEYTGISCQGTYLSEAQLEKLENFRPLIIMPDGDEAGRKMRNRIIKKIKKIQKVYFCGGYRGDPDELPLEKLKNVLKEKLDWFEYSRKFWRQL